MGTHSEKIVLRKDSFQRKDVTYDYSSENIKQKCMTYDRTTVLIKYCIIDTRRLTTVNIVTTKYSDVILNRHITLNWIWIEYINSYKLNKYYPFAHLSNNMHDWLIHYKIHLYYGTLSATHSI